MEDVIQCAPVLTSSKKDALESKCIANIGVHFSLDGRDY